MTALTTEQTVKTACNYYRNTVKQEPDDEKQVFFRRAAESGLTFAELWAAIDYAVSVVGLYGIERDYWKHIQGEARRIWKEMNRGDRGA